MSVPAYSIHTIHGTFSGLPLLSSYSRASHSPSSRYTYAGVVIDNHHAANSAWRAAPVLLPSSPSPRRQVPMSMAESRILRTSTAQPPTTMFASQDPFDDINVVPVPLANTVQGAGGSGMQLVSSRTQRICVASTSTNPTVRLPRTSSLDVLVRQRTAQRVAAQDHEARLKVVAGILLNRGNNNFGRCGRRNVPPCRGNGAPRTYRRSSLSTMISVDDI
ncbi:hypothetical protein V8B97DRAFT_1553747 [Scleroderma yunnanense]